MFNKRHRSGFAILAAAALILTACGSGASDEPDPSDASDAPAGSDEIREHKVTFALITADTFPYSDGAEKFKEVLEESTDRLGSCAVWRGRFATLSARAGAARAGSP